MNRVVFSSIYSVFIIFDQTRTLYLYPLRGDFPFFLIPRFDGQQWANNGPLLVTRIMKNNWCRNLDSFTAGGLCRGVTLLQQNVLYPITWRTYRTLFDESLKSLRYVLSQIKDSYTVHWSNKLSAGLPIKWNSKTQPIARLAATFCPVTSENAELHGTTR